MGKTILMNNRFSSSKITNILVFLCLNYIAVNLLKNFVLANDIPYYLDFYDASTLANLSIINLFNEYIWKNLLFILNSLGLKGEFVFSSLSYFIYTFFSYYVFKSIKNFFKCKNNLELYFLYIISILFVALPQTIVPVFNQVRNGLAITIIIPALINNFSFLNTLFLILISSLLHKSSFFFLVPLITFYSGRKIVSIKNNRKISRYLIILFPSLFFLFSLIFYLLWENVGMLDYYIDLGTSLNNFKGIFVFFALLLLIFKTNGLFKENSLITHCLLFINILYFFTVFSGRLYTAVNIPVLFFIFKNKNKEIIYLYILLIVFKSLFEIKYAYLL